MSNSYISASDFFKTIRPDERVYFLVRHGERGHILPDDPDHGAFVGLTDKGREQALNLGRVMGSAVDSSAGIVSFFSSPVGRCVETAQNIGRGFYETIGGTSQCCATAGSHQMYVPFVESLQPLAEFFVEHYDAYMETHRTGFYQGICRWLDGTSASPDYMDPAYFPLARRSQEMLDLMLSKGKSRINVFCSHDAWIVPCLAHFCGFKFTPRLWMNFLTGIAFVVREGTTAKVDRIAAVTGIEDGNLFF